MQNLKVASVQMNATSNKDSNLRRILSKIEEASGKEADLIVFPEYSMFYPLRKDLLENLSEPINGPFVNAVRDAAKSYNINVIVSINERSEMDEQRIYDTSILISNRGCILSVYRKTHLFDAFNIKESSIIIPGESLSKPVKIGDFNIGMLICYDVRFPENARTLAVEGCNLLCVSSAWFSGILKEVHLLTMLRARAIENGLYVVMANQTQPCFCGRSVIIDPFGVIIADAGEMEDHIIYADLSLQRVLNVRRLLPQLEQRRPELYYNLVK